MADYVITLPPTGNVLAASITLRTGTLATAKTIDLEDKTDVPVVGIDGFIRWDWKVGPDGKRTRMSRGGPCSDELLSLYPDNPVMQAIHPLMNRWENQTRRIGTRDQIEHLDATKSDPKSAVDRLEEAGLKTDRGHIYNGKVLLVEEIPQQAIDDLIAVFAGAQ